MWQSEYKEYKDIHGVFKINFFLNIQTFLLNIKVKYDITNKHQFKNSFK